MLWGFSLFNTAIAWTFSVFPKLFGYVHFDADPKTLLLSIIGLLCKYIFQRFWVNLFIELSKTITGSCFRSGFAPSCMLEAVLKMVSVSNNCILTFHSMQQIYLPYITCKKKLIYNWLFHSLWNAFWTSPTFSHSLLIFQSTTKLQFWAFKQINWLIHSICHNFNSYLHI